MMWIRIPDDKLEELLGNAKEHIQEHIRQQEEEIQRLTRQLEKVKKQRDKWKERARCAEKVLEEVRTLAGSLPVELVEFATRLDNCLREQLGWEVGDL